jgi:hypothetical protein
VANPTLSVCHAHKLLKKMSTEHIKIRRIGESGNAYLKLEGTVLLVNQKNWFSEFKLMIPIESIHISEHARFYKDLLTLVLLIPLLPFVVFMFMYLLGEITLNGIQENLNVIILVIAIFEFWMLFALVFNFLFTKKTVRLSIANPPIDIEFWKKRRDAKRIDFFLNQIKQKQLQFHDDSKNQPVKVFEISNTNPLGRLFGLWMLFCLPAVILQKYALLCLSLIPIAGYFYSSFKIMKQPNEFRQALKKIRHKKWDKAIELLKHLHEELPEYIPAIYLLIYTYIDAEKFDEALNFVDTVPENYFPDSNAIRLNLWKWKRINIRRIESD